jgi:hypothetical protein
LIGIALLSRLSERSGRFQSFNPQALRLSTALVRFAEQAACSLVLRPLSTMMHTRQLLHRRQLLAPQHQDVGLQTLINEVLAEHTRKDVA